MREKIAQEILEVPNTRVRGVRLISVSTLLSTSKANFEAATEWIQEVEVVLERSIAVVWLQSNRILRNFFAAEKFASEQVRVSLRHTIPGAV